jgi:hypothetical protein
VFRLGWCLCLSLRSLVLACRAPGRCGGFRGRGLLLRGYRGTGFGTHCQVHACLVALLARCIVLTSAGRPLSGANAS